MRVLFVDDEERYWSRVVDTLTANGFVVDAVQSAEEAVNSARVGDYAAGIVDLYLTYPPVEMDGLELIANLRRVRRRYFPILVLTNDDSIETEVRILSTEVNEYVAKSHISAPSGPKLLLARLNKMIIGKAHRNMKIRRGPICLDLNNARVVVSGTTVELTKLEYYLFRILMIAEGPQSSESIVCGIWPDGKGSTNTLNVHMRNLRKKLDPKEVLDPIKYVREIGGYRIREFDV